MRGGGGAPGGSLSGLTEVGEDSRTWRVVAARWPRGALSSSATRQLSGASARRSVGENRRDGQVVGGPLLRVVAEAAGSPAGGGDPGVADDLDAWDVQVDAGLAE
jgi:hypothetical protein